VSGVPPPKIAVPPPGDAVVERRFSGKIIKIVDTRGQILKLKCTKFDLGCGSASDTTAYSAPQTS